MTAFFVDTAVVFGAIVGLLITLTALEPGTPNQRDPTGNDDDRE